MTKRTKTVCPVWSEDPELNNFCESLLDAVRDMKADQALRRTGVEVPRIVDLRNRAGLTQKQFAKLLGVSLRTLQSWEQGVRQPSSAAVTLLRMADLYPNDWASLATPEN